MHQHTASYEGRVPGAESELVPINETFVLLQKVSKVGYVFLLMLSSKFVADSGVRSFVPGEGAEGHPSSWYC